MCVAWVMYVSAAEGGAGGVARLSSSNMMLYEGDTKCLSFWYILSTGDQGDPDTLSVHTEDTEVGRLHHSHRTYHCLVPGPHGDCLESEHQLEQLGAGPGRAHTRRRPQHRVRAAARRRPVS